MISMSEWLGGALLALGVIVSTPGVAAQADYEPPRRPDGTPDLQGVWTNASLTRMTRPPEFDDLIIPQEKIDEITYNSYYNRRLREDNKPTDPTEGAPTDGNTRKGYNNFWIDPGSAYGKIDGEYRSSWIIEPEDGQVPLSSEGRLLRARAFRQGGGDEGSGGRGGMYDHVEMRPLGERCLISFGSSAGPPMNNVMYNNHYQFVQTPDHVMINVEMNHDVRIIDLNGKHDHDNIREWFGSSVGHWEGDTLVVETRNVHPLQETRGRFPLSPEGKVIERFTRVSDTEMLYEFTVNDPLYYTQTWKGEMIFTRDDERIFEYACHEGNYALPGILAGARAEEREKGKSR
ncbi:hypothetical protein ACXYTJ_09475 [Gilvimarinus sp. F26214L]|uniref:hypothetical protein n=1 Tax=Gilvimarinus sp. DZF01 TaxID=3461371 RepID=UPI0040456C90